MTISLGIDLGTTSVSVVALSESGEVVSVVNEAHQAAVETSEFHAEQSPHVIREVAIKLVRQVIEESRQEPVAVGITGQMHGGLLVGQNGEPLSNLITWQDKRSLQENQETGTSPFAELRGRIGDIDLKRTGCRPRPGFGAVTLFTLRQLSALPARPFQFATIMDWFASSLTVSKLAIDRTNAGSWGIYDLEDDCWHEGLLRRLQLKEQWLPSVKASGEVLGVTTERVTSELGLRTAVQVSLPIGDNQASYLGSVSDPLGTVHLNIGTGGQINVCSERLSEIESIETRYLLDPSLTATGKPLYLLVGAGLAGGDAYAWLAKSCQQSVRDFGVTMSLEAVYDRLADLINRQEETSLTCEPFFRGTRFEPDRRGVFSGVDETNFRPGEMGLAIVRGIADVFWNQFQRLNGSGRGLSEDFSLVATGNGITHIPRLQAELARLFTKTVQVSRVPESAAVGAAMLAGVRMELWKSFDEIQQRIKVHY